MSIVRVIPMLTVDDLPTALTFYRNVLGMEVVTHTSWIATLSDGHDYRKQLALITTDPHAPCNPDLSVQVSDVDAVYRAARGAKAEILYPLTDEPWGARRFFLRDRCGNVLNVLAPT
jgi:uncharacterized glyoxalase superfamily protein PhnB